MAAQNPSTEIPLSVLAGLGEDPADLQTDLHPYLRFQRAVAQPPSAAGRGYSELVQRRWRTQRLTPGGLAQPPELAGVDADARVPNALQPMSGEFSAGALVAAGAPAFHNPAQPPPTGVASRETAALGLLQRGAALPATAAHPELSGLPVPPVSNERGPGNAPPAAVLARLEEGVRTTFQNGQIWTRRDGKPRRLR
jgi:hypothetical protein